MVPVMAVSIDPRVAELLGHDHHLPAVDPQRLSQQALVERFLTPPVWAPDVSVERWASPPDPVRAAVLVPIVMRPEPAVLLTQRTATLRKHAGQISFPGGRSEPEDPDAVATALREAQEEVGLAPPRVHVLGELPEYTTGTGFVVTPVVGLIAPHPHETPRLDLRPDPGEVAEVFEVPLSFLMDPQHHQRRAFGVPSLEMGRDNPRIEFFSMPWRPVGEPDREYFIWGATAAMLRNLYRFLSA